MTLAGGHSVTCSVTFTPPSAGTDRGSVWIAFNTQGSHNGGNHSPTFTGSPSVTLPLAGTGVIPGQLTANPTSLGFGSVPVGSSQTMTETLTNSGGSSLTISAVTASGSGFSVSGLALPLTLNNVECWPEHVLHRTLFTYDERLSQWQRKYHFHRLQLEHSTFRNGRDAVSADRQSHEPCLRQRSGWQQRKLVRDPDQYRRIEPDDLSRHPQWQRLQFERAGLTLTLNAGQSTSFTVLFSPTTSGSASGSVSITSTASNLSIPLSGTGVTQGTLNANPTSLAFGSVQVGSSASLSETLTNSGGSSLTISAASASGSGFSLSGLALPFTLNAGQSTSFTVLFSPTTSGAASGNVSITSNGANPNLSIPLSGTGVTQGTLNANPTSLGFGSVQVGYSANLSETLTNTGGSTVTISQVHVLRAYPC